MTTRLKTTYPSYVPELSTGRNYPAGAMLLALLVDPPVAFHRNDWEQTFDMLKYCAIVDLAHKKPAVELTECEKEIFQHEPPRFKQRVARIHRRLRDRLVSARMAIGFFQEAEQAGSAVLPKGIERLSVNQMAALMLSEDETRESTPENIISRIWSPNRWVVHISAALAIEVALRETATGAKTAVSEILFDLDLVKRIIWRAELLEDMIPATKLGINKKKLVRIRLPSEYCPQEEVMTSQ